MLFEPLDYPVHGGADARVLARHTELLDHLPLARAREPSARRGPRLVHRTEVVGTEEGARRGVHRVLPVFLVLHEVALDEVARLEAEVAGEARDVVLPHPGAGGLAAVGTSEAVDVLKRFVVEVVEGAVEVLGFLALQLLEQVAVALLRRGGLFCETGPRRRDKISFVGAF